MHLFSGKCGAYKHTRTHTHMCTHTKPTLKCFPIFWHGKLRATAIFSACYQIVLRWFFGGGGRHSFYLPSPKKESYNIDDFMRRPRVSYRITSHHIKTNQANRIKIDPENWAKLKRVERCDVWERARARKKKKENGKSFPFFCYFKCNLY